MKKKELNELKTKTAEDLAKMVEKKREELGKVKRDILEGKEKNLRKGKLVRHEIAQILTIKGIIERENNKEDKE